MIYACRSDWLCLTRWTVTSAKPARSPQTSPDRPSLSILGSVLKTDSLEVSASTSVFLCCRTWLRGFSRPWREGLEDDKECYVLGQGCFVLRECAHLRPTCTAAVLERTDDQKNGVCNSLFQTWHYLVNNVTIAVHVHTCTFVHSHKHYCTIECHCTLCPLWLLCCN